MSPVTFQTAGPVEELRLNQTARSWAELIANIRDGLTTVDAPYQRGDVWTQEQQMLLIFSILSGTPIPAIIINVRPDRMWADGPDLLHGPDGKPLPMVAVIDGRQRLTAVRMFMDDRLAVPASWWKRGDVEDSGKTADGPYVSWLGLSRGRRLHFGHTPVPVAEGHLPSLEAEAEVYLRVNGAGTPQSAGDMARAKRVASGG
jgi:Protein of unknown function DUF262